MENRNNRNCRRCNCEEERGEMDSRNCNPCGNGTLGANVNNDCLADALEDAYNDGYKDGYRDGYEDGNTAGEQQERQLDTSKDIALGMKKQNKRS